MYNYDFNNEKVIQEFNNLIITVNNKEIFINLLITNKNLLLFTNNANDFINMKVQGVFIIPNYELLAKIDLTKIKYKYLDDNTYLEDLNIVIYNFNLKKILNK